MPKPSQHNALFDTTPLAILDALFSATKEGDFERARSLAESTQEKLGRDQPSLRKKPSRGMSF